jgi:hypothetical protein
VIRPRRDGWQVIVYTGIDPVTGRQRQIRRQVNGSRKQAERVETRLKAEVMTGRHRGTAVIGRSGFESPSGSRSEHFSVALSSPKGCAHSTSVRIGFPFSTTSVASSAALPLPTFFTAWIAPAGTNKTSPALTVVGGWPST